MRAGLVAVAFAAACAHTPNLPLRPDPAPPSGSTTWVFKARDNTELLARRWAAGTASATNPPAASSTNPPAGAPTASATPAEGSARGVVVIMHGLKDYSARYDAFAQKLVAKGYVVYAFDLRGHGRSAGPRVDPDKWTDYVDDLDRFLTEVEKREPGKPVFLFGHSMGGAIATLTAEIHTPKLAGLVLSGPALAVDAPPLQIAAAVMAGLLSPGFGALTLDNHDFSSDPANAAAMDKDELIESGPGPASTAAGLIDGMRRIWAGTDELTMPVLAMHGTADKLTAPWGSFALIRRLGSGDHVVMMFEHYNHDLLHEPNGNGDRVATTIITWLDRHVDGGKTIDPATLTNLPPGGHVELGGRPRGWTQEVLLAAGVEHETNTSFAGQLDLDIARPKLIGWYGNLEGRLGDIKAVAVRPLGLSIGSRLVTGGIAAGAALMSGTKLAYSGRFWGSFAGFPLVHIDLFFTADVTFDRGSAGYDEERYGLMLRLPSDKYYWPRALAGVGPAIIGGQDCSKTSGTSSTCAWFAMLGLELFGTD